MEFYKINSIILVALLFQMRTIEASVTISLPPRNLSHFIRPSIKPAREPTPGSEVVVSQETVAMDAETATLISIPPMDESSTFIETFPTLETSVTAESITAESTMTESNELASTTLPRVVEQTPEEAGEEEFTEAIRSIVDHFNQLSTTNSEAVDVLVDFENQLRARALEINDNFTYTEFDITIFIQQYTAASSNINIPLISLPKHTVESITPDLNSDNTSVAITELSINAASLATFIPDISNEPTLRISEYFVLDNIPIISITVYDNSNNFTTMNSEVEFTADLSNSTNQTQALLNTFYSNSRISVESVEYICGFLNLTTGEYSTDGCRNTGRGNNVRCVCEHTTIFAVLLSVTYVEIPEGLQMYSYVIGSITIASLFITVVILVMVRKRIRNDRIVIQINLAVSLLFLHLMSLVEDSAKQDRRSCEFVAVSIHYFLLASGFWMLLEGVTLITKTSRKSLSFDGNSKKNLNLFRYICGYGIAAVFVVIAASVGFTNEDNTYIRTVDNSITDETIYKNCFINSSSTVLYVATVIAPLAVIISVNFIIIVKVAIFVFKLSKDAVNYKPSCERINKNKLDSLTSALKAASTLEPVLGITWVFGFLVALPNLTASTAFLAINITINGLQGLFVLLIYCVYGSEVRKALVEYRKKQRTKTPGINEVTPQMQRTNNLILSDTLRQHRGSKTTSLSSSPGHYVNKV